MDRNRLEKLLTELRAEVADARDVDPAARESLRQLADELDRLAGEDPGFTTPQSLNDLALRFESEHPRLGAILAQMMDTLGKMGI